MITLLIFGLGVGSFLNVVVFRLGTGEKIGNSRSRCFSCGYILGWYELIPLASFFIQKARCIKCGSRISWQYPVVELLTGALFILIAWNLRFGVLNITSRDFLELMFWLIIFSLLLVISIYDFWHKIIPNQLVYPFIILSFFYIFGDWISESWRGGDFMGYLFAGAGAFLFFGGLWFISGGRWMGFGDAKLALGIGFLLGFPQTILAMVLSFWIGTLVALPLLLLKKKTIKAEIPFGPFLVVGMFMMWLMGDLIIETYFGIFI